jgi:E3 SUMO-protein ligase PIAS1
MSPSNIETLHPTSANDDDDDEEEIQEVTSSVSLVCPLMIDKIIVPAKGLKCRHPNCFDLRTFLSLAEQSYNWQCPICIQPLPETELRVDLRMEAILKLSPEDVEEVRIMPDGNVEMIHEENDRKRKRGSDEEGTDSEDEFIQSSKKAKASVSSSGGVVGSRDEPIELD